MQKQQETLYKRWIKEEKNPIAFGEMWLDSAHGVQNYKLQARFLLMWLMEHYLNLLHEMVKN